MYSYYSKQMPCFVNKTNLIYTLQILGSVPTYSRVVLVLELLRPAEDMHTIAINSKQVLLRLFTPICLPAMCTRGVPVGLVLELIRPHTHTHERMLCMAIVTIHQPTARGYGYAHCKSKPVQFSSVQLLCLFHTPHPHLLASNSCNPSPVLLLGAALVLFSLAMA